MCYRCQIYDLDQINNAVWKLVCWKIVCHNERTSEKRNGTRNESNRIETFFKTNDYTFNTKHNATYETISYKSLHVNTPDGIRC